MNAFLRFGRDSDDEGPPVAKEDDFDEGFYGRPSLPSEDNVTVEKLIDIDNDTKIPEENDAARKPHPKHIPEISHEGQTEAVCEQRSAIKPSSKDIEKVQAIACQLDFKSHRQVKNLINSHTYSHNDLKQISASCCSKQSLVSVPSYVNDVINIISMHLLFKS